MLYIGNKGIDQHTGAAMTYQNVWGMSPASHDKRYVIGQSLFFPLLKNDPDHSDISSLAGKSDFKLIYLDELNVKADSPSSFANRFIEPFHQRKSVTLN